MLGENLEVDEFYNDNFDSPMRSYNEMQKEIQDLHVLTTNDRDDIQQFSLDINQLIISISNLDFEIFQSSTISEREQLIIEKNQKEVELLGKSNLLRDLREQIETDRIPSAQVLRTVNNRLPNTNIAALNEKRINRVALNMIINPNYLDDAGVQNLVAGIANQCTAAGGLAVYRARSIHDYIHPGNQNDYRDIDNCYENPESSERSSDQPLAHGNLLDIEVYPNPTTGTIFISIEKSIDEGNIIVRDLLGREIKNIRIDQNLLRLDLQAERGVYFISINDGNQYLENVKVIVQ